MSKRPFSQTTQSVNGIRIQIFQWGKLMIVRWDGSPVSTMPQDAWYDLPISIPQQEIDPSAPIQPVCRTCGNLHTYTVQCQADKLRFYPISGAITADDSVSGQVLTLANQP